MDPKSICSSTFSGSSSSSAKAWIVHGLVAGVAVALAARAYAHMHLLRPSKFRSRVVGIIPARLALSRFHGKPLVQIPGKPMIQRTWERAKLVTTLDHVGMNFQLEWTKSYFSSSCFHVLLTESLVFF